MKKQMSQGLKRMTGLYRWVIPVVFLYIIAFSFFLGGMGMKFLGSTKPDVEPVEFHVYDGEDIYSSLKAQMMTQEFASDFKETNHYYFIYDENLLPFIVQVHGVLPEEYLKIQSYLYDESEESPEPATFYGMSAPIEEDIRTYAIESYNDMWGEELVTEDNFSDYFGEYYLDTTKKPASNAGKTISLVFLYAFTAALAGTLILVWNLNSRSFKKSRATLKAWPEERLLKLDGQLQVALSLAYGKKLLYLTEDYMVTDAEGFDIIPYEAIDRIYDTSSATEKRLGLETTDGEHHTLAIIKRSGRVKEEAFQELILQVKKKIAGKKEELPESLLTGRFYMDPGNEDPEAVLQVSAALELKPSNPFLGVIGALFASLLGVGLWVFIGQVGFIAGIAGFVMLKLALSGYEKLGGSLDKKGAVLCLILTAGMIAGANLLDYAVSMVRAYFQYEASFETLIYVFANFGNLMSEMDMWGEFFLDLAIGYGLSIWSGAGAIKAIMNMEK
ncbi:hypothetical protein [Lacrimispora brassicae]